MFEYGYLQNSDVATPQALIKLSNPLEPSRSCNVNAIVDTAASKTCIPESVIKELGQSLIYSQVMVQDADGNVKKHKTYFLDISLDGYEFKDIEVVAIPKGYALIGRDILNQQMIVLNAPIGRWSFGCNDEICPIERS